MPQHHHWLPAAVSQGDLIRERFFRAVAANPESPALISLDTCISYGTLAAKATAVAARLKDEPGKPVSILSRCIVTTVAGMLGALFAGRPYVVIEPDWPEERIRCLADSIRSAEWVVDDAHHQIAARLASSLNLAARFITADSDTTPFSTRADVSPDAHAYIAFTSGSTGRPKGVIHTRANLLHEIEVHTQTLGLTARDRFTLLYSPSAVGCVRDLFGALLNGATLLHFPFKERGFGPLSDWLREQRATLFHAVPEIFRRFAAETKGRPRLDSVRVAFLAGDRVRSDDVTLARTVFGPACRFYTGLGSSEANSLYVHRFVEESDLPADGPLPAGKPVPDKIVEVLDEDGRPVTNGAVGEIVVRSRFISPGYWSDPDRTREVFSPVDTATGELGFRTGDFGAWNEAGLLVWHGRRDQQAKINGVRIALQEVEAALRSLPGVRDAVIRVVQDPTQTQRLAAYFVPDEPAPSPATLRKGVSAKLPGAAVPTLWFRLDAIPLNPNGKLDASRLPTTPEPSEKGHFIPTTTAEAALVTAWCDVLRNDGPLPGNIPFGLLGGDSLAAVQLAERLSVNPGIALSAADFAQGLTLNSLAARLRNRNPDQCGVIVREDSTLLRKLRESWAGTPIPTGAEPVGGGIGWRLPGSRKGIPLCWFGGVGAKEDFLMELAEKRPVIRMPSGVGILPFDPADWHAPVREMAALMAHELPDGCEAAGWCSGGQGALLMARIWRECGIDVKHLWLVEVFGSRWARYVIRDAAPRLRPRHRLRTVLAALRRQPAPPPRATATPNRLDFHHEPYPGPATLVFSRRSWRDRWITPGMGWPGSHTGRWGREILPGEHDTLFAEPYSRPLIHLLTSNT